MFFKKFKTVDTELHQFSQLLSFDESNPVPHEELLDFKVMDYSLESLQTVEQYLIELPPHELEKQYNQIVLIVGAYVGEVIKQHLNSDFHWYDNETAIEIDREMEQWEGIIETSAVLYSHKKNQFIFPLAKVCKFINNGSEDSLLFFAKVLIERGRL